MASNWYYSDSDGRNRVGPLSSHVLKTHAADGLLKPTNMLWREGMDKPKPAARFSGIFDTPDQPVTPPAVAEDSGMTQEMPQFAEPQWFYADGNKQIGPYILDELRELARVGTLRPANLVWNASLAEWIPSSEVAGLFSPGQTSDPLDQTLTAVEVFGQGWVESQQKQDTNPEIAIDTNPEIDPQVESLAEIQATDDGDVTANAPSSQQSNINSSPGSLGDAPPTGADAARPRTASELFVMSRGVMTGPHTSAEIRKMLANGTISDQDLVRLEVWVPCSFLRLIGPQISAE